MIEDAVLVAAGRGTRMLPASLFAPKETLPLIDTPILNHLIWEATKSGVTRIHLILSEYKFQQLSGLFGGKKLDLSRFRPDLPEEAITFGTSGVEIIPWVQKNPNGVMDAIAVSLEEIDGAFLVLLGDMLLMDGHFGPKSSGPAFASSASKKLVSSYMETGLPCVGVNTVDRDEVKKYGAVEVVDGSVVNIIEKPSPGQTKSNFVLSGRYIFPAGTKQLVEKFSFEEFGELQSIEILRYLAQDVGLNAVSLDGMEIYDSGDPLVWLKSQIDHALRREDISEEIRKFIKGVI